MRFHSPPFLLRMEAWNQETKDNVNGMHSSCVHPQLQPRCLPACGQDQALAASPRWPRRGSLTKAQAGQRVQHLVRVPRAVSPPRDGQRPSWPRGQAGTDRAGLLPAPLLSPPPLLRPAGRGTVPCQKEIRPGEVWMALNA